MEAPNTQGKKHMSFEKSDTGGDRIGKLLQEANLEDTSINRRLILRSLHEADYGSLLRLCSFSKEEFSKGDFRSLQEHLFPEGYNET